MPRQPHQLVHQVAPVFVPEVPHLQLQVVVELVPVLVVDVLQDEVEAVVVVLARRPTRLRVRRRVLVSQLAPRKPVVVAVVDLEVQLLFGHLRLLYILQ